MKSFYKYLPVSDGMRHSALYVHASGYSLVPPHTPYPPRPHPADHHFEWDRGRTLHEFQIIYLAKGRGLFESKSGGSQKLNAGTLFMLFPGEWHRYGPDPETGWDEYWLAFNGSQAQQLAREHGLSPASPLLETQVSDTIVEEYLRIAEELRREEVGWSKIAAARATLILAGASALAKRKTFEGSGILFAIEQAKVILAGSIDKEMNMEELAVSLRVGYSLFRRDFRVYTGLSPAQYHLELRINHAASLLRATTLPAALIGERIGMDSPGYFSRIFKKKTGFTPVEFRAAARKR